MATKRKPNRYIRQLKDGRWQLSHPYEKARTFKRYDSAKRRLDRLVSGEADPRTCRPFTEAEDAIIARLWRNRSNRQEHIEAQFVGRSYGAIKGRARLLGLARGADVLPALWTTAEIETLVEHVDDRALLARLLPGRTPRAIELKIDKLGLIDKGTRLSEEEERLLRTIHRARAKLLLTRERREIARLLKSLTLAGHHRNQLLRQVRETIPAHLPADIKEDVHNSVLLAVLEDKRLLIDLPGTVKSIITKTYGPRTYSLDAPVSDGSGMNWIDTIESERPHF